MYKIKRPERNSTQDLTFPEESSLVVEVILKEYGLSEEQKEGIKKFLTSQNPTERKRLFESLPGTKLSKLIKEYAEGKISLEGLPDLLAEQLNVPEVKAKEIAEFLKENLLTFIKPRRKQKSEGILPKTKVPPQEQKASPQKLKKRDIYREPIE